MSTTDKTKKSFTGTQNYIATDDLQLAVNAAMTLQKPLLIKGEPGTGKTLLAEEVAESLGMPLITWHIKSTTKLSKGRMSTMPYRACVIRNWATTRCMRLATISSLVNCGKPLRAVSAVCY